MLPMIDYDNMGSANINDKQQQAVMVSSEVKQVVCGTLNTVVLTNAGEIYVIGSNTFG